MHGRGRSSGRLAKIFVIRLYCIRIPRRSFRAHDEACQLAKLDAALGDRHSCQIYSAPTAHRLGVVFVRSLVKVRSSPTVESRISARKRDVIR